MTGILRRISYFTLILIFISQSNLFSQWTKTVVAVTGTVVNSVNKGAISVKITVLDNTGKKFTSTKSNASDNGYYFVTGLTPGNSYTFEIESDDYMNEFYTISIPNTDKYLEISKDFSLNPKKIDAKILLSVSPFEFNKSKLRFGASTILENIASTMKNNPNVKFIIRSYPDNAQDVNYNLELTTQRADAIYDYFIANGIDASRMKIEDVAYPDPDLPPPAEKRAKGKRYIGSTYLVISGV